MIRGSSEGQTTGGRLSCAFKPPLWSRSVGKGLSVPGKALPGKMLEQEREGVVLLRVLYFGGGWLEKFLHLSEEFICKPNNVIYVELCLYSAVQNLYGTINSSR